MPLHSRTRRLPAVASQFQRPGVARMAPQPNHGQVKRRLKFSQNEIQNQLAQLHLVSSSCGGPPPRVSPANMHIPISSHPCPLAQQVTLNSLVPFCELGLASEPWPKLSAHLGTNLCPRSLNIHRSRQQNDYLKALKVFVAEKESEIETVCASNYQVREACATRANVDLCC